MPDQLATLGRYTGPATLILSSLAGGAKHGYALMQDIEAFADVTLRPGTLYGALSRLETMELIAPLEGDGRRRPYRLTNAGAAALQVQLAAQRKVADVGLGRLSAAGVPA
jgi:DNA-binding PadR family transcriptional regulator